MSRKIETIEEFARVMQANWSMGNQKWRTSEERELKLLNLLKSGISVTQIKKDEHTSERLLVKIRRKYGLYGA